MTRYVLITAIAVLSGCATQAADPVGRDGQPAPETVTTPRGGVFVRADLWDPIERAHMRKLSKASQLPGATTEEIAEGLRGVMQHNNGHIYIEREPSYELARMIQEEEKYELEEEVPSTTEEQTVGRLVFGNDNRTNDSRANGGWQAALAFQTSGCSGTRIGEHTAVTAAHCVYQTLGDEEDNGWNCFDGSVSDGQYTACPDLLYPQWVFGVNGTATHSNAVWALPNFEGWAICAKVIIPQSFIDDEDEGWATARHDYAVIDFSSCPASTWPNGTRSFGTDTMTDSELASMTGNAAGYPYKTGCPSGSNGNPYLNIFMPGDCNMGMTQYGGEWVPDPPFDSAELYVSTSTDITAGTDSNHSAYTIQSKADVTKGQSGGPLFKIAGADRLLIGILSQSASAGNRYRRWTSSLHTWVADHSLFPDD